MVKRKFLKSAGAGSMGVLLGASNTAEADFISDSKASILVRTLYFNNDNRETHQVKQEEAGQGFLFKYQSGFTEGTVGLGGDAIGALGIKLDSAKGRRNGSSFFPNDGNRVPFISQGYGSTVYLTSTVKSPALPPRESKLGWQVTSMTSQS